MRKLAIACLLISTAIQAATESGHPVLRDHLLLFSTRRQYKKDHHNTATIFQKGEINERSYDPPGKIKLLNPRTGAVKTLVDAGVTGIARDPELSADGTRVIFSMRKSIDDDYHIYEINIDGTGLKQLTSLRGVSDIDPAYLPDGKIVFSSTREPKFCMCNRHIMANLYRMDADGANIHQIGKSTLFEGHSSIMEDGRILYDRWEYVDRNFGDAQGLWTVNPDGTMHALFYGNNTCSPGGIIDARQIPGAQRVIAVFSSCHDRPWGALAILNRDKGIDGAEGVEHIWPASARTLIGKGNWDAFRKVRPRYEDPFPLSTTHFLCARTIVGDDERTGIYMIDTSGNEELLYEDPEGMGCYDPMPVVARKQTRIKPNLRDFTQASGTFYVQDVYEGTHMHGVQRGEVKFLRVVESPEKRSFSRGGWMGQGQQFPAMNWHSFENKRILGVVPVEEDGSAFFEVPSERFIYFQLLDQDGKMIQSMRSGTIIQPGEQQGCVGCHENRIEPPPTSARGQQALSRPPTPMGQGYGAGQVFSYLTEIQPIFDRNCVTCHDFDKPAGKTLNLAGDKELAFNASYVDLHRKKIIQVAGGGKAETYPAKAWGSHASQLTRFLDGHEHTNLTDEEKRIIYTWIDLNGTYYPSYDSAFPLNPAGRSPISHQQVKRLIELCGVNLKKGLSWETHPGAMISFDRPELSPCLKTLDKDSSDYQEALSIIETGRRNLESTPRADMPGFVPSQNDINRSARYEELRKVEAAYRQAIREGKKLYDTDMQTTKPSGHHL